MSPPGIVLESTRSYLINGIGVVGGASLCARGSGPGRSSPASRFAARKNAPPRRVLALPAAAGVIRTTAGIGWTAGARRSVVANPRRRRTGPLRAVLDNMRVSRRSRSAGSDRPGPLVARPPQAAADAHDGHRHPLARRSLAVSDWSDRTDLERPSVRHRYLAWDSTKRCL